MQPWHPPASGVMVGSAQRTLQLLRWPASDKKAKWAKPLLTPPTSPERYRYSLLATIAPDHVRSARPDCSQSDCEHREDYKDCTSIAHGRTRSAQCTSATPNNTDAIPIHCAIIFASYPAVK